MLRLRRLVPSCRFAALAVACVLASSACSPDGAPPPRPGPVRRVEPSLSPPLLLLPPLPGPPSAPYAVEREAVLAEAPQWGPDPVLQPGAPPAGAPIPAGPVNREGLGAGLVSPITFVPPDPSGDVGANHYVQAVNTHLLVLDKGTGATVYGPVPLRTLWTGFTADGGLCAGTNQADPVVLYDHLEDRWLITLMANRNATPAWECVAVSATPDPTGPWHRYAFGPYADSSHVTPAANDYPKLAVWPDAYYVSYAMKLALPGAKLCAWERAEMLAGRAAREVCFDLGGQYVGGILPADLDGLTLPPPGAPALFLGREIIGNIVPEHYLLLWRFRVDWADPAASRLEGPPGAAGAEPERIAVEPFNLPCPAGAPRDPLRPGACIAQAGADQLLDALGNTLMHRVVYRRLASGAEVVVANHTVDTGEEHPDFPGTPLGRTGVRWYELRSGAGPMGAATPVVAQQGTFAPADGSSRWMGSVAVDQAGNVALVYSVAGAVPPGLRYAGRSPGDAPNALTRAEGDLLSGVATVAQEGSPRWGDYSSLAVDPSDECTFWATGEYLTGVGTAASALTWRTRIGTFRFESCPSVRYRIDAAPGVQAGQALGLSLTAVDPSGATATGYAGAAALTASPGGAVSAAQATFAAGVAAGSLSARFEGAGSGWVRAREVAYPRRSSLRTLEVAPAAAARLAFTGLPAAAVAGVPTPFAIEARDAFGNLAAGYAGAAVLSATGGAVSPGTARLAAGRSVEALSVTFTAAGTQALTVHAAGPPAVSGAQAVAISPAPASSYAFSALPASVSAGQEVRFTLRAVDAYGNVDLAYGGTANLSCSDPLATHPAAVPFAAGVTGDVPITLRSAGPQTITATDATNPALKALATVSSGEPPPPPPPPPAGSGGGGSGGGGGCGYGAGRGLEALGLAAALLLRRRRSPRGAPRPRS